eukprot:TRINITY_DN14880_c0_g1::TRINITY_DN14880_c0_g1_i1::g.16177::m.16177 TRINITY_DN14880_c0_g1::TRINITY_DN14880_c0_g1_i1::g.16177  ORF type:complete len:202 (-),score=20.78,sp/Q28CH8/YIPF6_XENTR/46.20/2e-51,Yip1/PF04893.12/2.3e-14 TRINITY_DN14880_c0_g1_i1:371-976(-)
MEDTIDTLPSNTLDEPISTTLMRDFTRVAKRLRMVLVPKYGDIRAELRDWDLWGPLVICLLLAVQLSFQAPDDEISLIFTATFVVMWFGAAAITLNARLLGGTLSFWQSVCLLGYCVFPLCAAALLCLFINFGMCNTSAAAWILRIIIVIAACSWATIASIGFLSEVVTPERRVLAVYPVLLFYIALAWMVLLVYSWGNDC